jgi:hypothetical protein
MFKKEDEILDIALIVMVTLLIISISMVVDGVLK